MLIRRGSSEVEKSGDIRNHLVLFIPSFQSPCGSFKFTMPDIEAPTAVHVNTDEKKDDSSSFDGNWSYTAGGSRDPEDMVRRRLKQRHIQM